MKVELRSNGKLELLLTPETPLERIFLESMGESAARKNGVSALTYVAEDDWAILSTEK